MGPGQTRFGLEVLWAFSANCKNAPSECGTFVAILNELYVLEACLAQGRQLLVHSLLGSEILLSAVVDNVSLSRAADSIRCLRTHRLATSLRRVAGRCYCNRTS